jgi:nicotinic acid phosphoribosyltransferase
LEGLLISEYSDHSSDIVLSTDFYEITMAAAYYYDNNNLNQNSKETKSGIFEMFVRKPPLNRSYIVVAGLEQVIYFLMNMEFMTNTFLIYSLLKSSRKSAKIFLST